MPQRDLNAVATTMNERDIWDEGMRRALPDDAWLLVVDVSSQQLAAWQKGRERSRHPVSTSKNGLGTEAGSEKTPGGWHEIVERIGHDAPDGRVFKNRKAQPRVLPPREWEMDDAEDLILSRILRLRGLEDGINRGPGIDSHDRLIYIHGTAEEHRLGSPVSHGCIRMGNQDIIGLFERLGDTPAWCWIGRLK